MHSHGRKGSQDSDGVTAISETVGRSSGELTPGGNPSKDNNEEDEARKGSVKLIDDEADVNLLYSRFRTVALLLT